MLWNNEERAFAVEAYLSNGRSVISAQRAFRNRFNVAPLGPVPGRNSILCWVTTFRESGNVQKIRTQFTRTVRSPANVEAVRIAILQSPQRSVRKHASALGMSERSVRRILHEDLHLHPYKLATVQEHINIADLPINNFTMSDDGAPVVEKRGRGRPAKDEKKEEHVAENNKAKKRGRPAKEASKKDVDAGGDDEAPVVKRGRGRPKKKKGRAAAAAKKQAAAAGKGRGRRRPKKEEKKEESEEEEEDDASENGDE